jgi:hypothetical protein
MATFRWMKSLRKGDRYEPGSPGGTKVKGQVLRTAKGNGGLTSFIYMSFNVPVSIDISRVVIFDTSRFDLLEAPLRKVDITGSEIATQR